MKNVKAENYNTLIPSFILILTSGDIAAYWPASAALLLKIRFHSNGSTYKKTKPRKTFYHSARSLLHIPQMTYRKVRMLQNFCKPADNILSSNPSIIFPETPKQHLPYTSELPATYLRTTNCITSALINAQVTHRDMRRYEAFSLQVYRKG